MLRPYNPSYLDTPCPVALVDNMVGVVVVALVARITQRDHEQLLSNSY